MKLGAFSISLSVKDIQASKDFYENLGFTAFGVPIGIVFGLFCMFFSASSQSDTKGTVVIKKPNCNDVTLHLIGFYKDTLTASEFNYAIGVRPEIKNCYETHIYNVLSFDISVNGQQSIHIEGPTFKKKIKKIVGAGVVSLTNCIVSVSGESLVVRKENGKQVIVDDHKIVIDETKIYIIPD